MEKTCTQIITILYKYFYVWGLNLRIIIFINFYLFIIDICIDFYHYYHYYWTSELLLNLWEYTQDSDITHKWVVYFVIILKNTIIIVPILISLDTTIFFHIKVNSLDLITRTILSQALKKDNKWHLLFFSKFLFSVEYNYEIYNKEILAVIHALEEWYYFLEEAITPVETWIDHKNLEYFIKLLRNWTKGKPNSLCTWYIF